MNAKWTRNVLNRRIFQTVAFESKASRMDFAPAVARRDSPGRSRVAIELTSEHYDDKNYQQQTQSAARIISPVRAVRPSGKRTQDEQDQEDQQD